MRATMNLMSLMALIALLSACGVPHIDPYVPKQRNYEVPVAKDATAEDASGSLWRPDGKNASLFSDYRAFREQDLVVVRDRRERRRQAHGRHRPPAQHRSQRRRPGLPQGGAGHHPAGRSHGRGQERPQLPGRRPDRPHREADRHRPRHREEGAAQRQPLHRGAPRRLVNNEEQHFYISGVVRPIDIAQDNSVRSSYVADAEIEFTGRGVLSDNQKPGLFSRFWNWIWPF